MLNFFFKPEWRKSSPHLLLLSQFSAPRTNGDFSRGDTWAQVLGEPPQDAIKHFVKEGILESASLAETLDYEFKATDLKKMLKERSLPILGKKEVLIARLIQADESTMRKLVADVKAYVHSAQGRILAEAYLGQEREKRRSAEQRTLEAIRKHKFREASQVVSAFESEQVFPRGMGVDWKNHDSSGDERLLEVIFKNKPVHIEGIDEKTLNVFQIHAAMMHLWSYSYLNYPVPPDIQTNSSMSGERIVDIIRSNAGFRLAMQDCRKSIAELKDVKHEIRIATCNDNLVCPSCRPLNQKMYHRIEDVPELPLIGCTSEHGCRCWAMWYPHLVD